MQIVDKVKINRSATLGDINRIITFLQDVKKNYPSATNIHISHSFACNEQELEIQREETREEMLGREIVADNKLAISMEAERVIRVTKAKKRVRMLGC